MDQEADRPLSPAEPGAAGTPDAAGPAGRLARRQVLRYGLGALAGASAIAGGVGYVKWRAASIITAEVFKNDAPDDALWQRWQAQGWVHEAAHYRKLGRNVQCDLCPNGCLLEPGDRSHCRNKVNREGTLYTLAYGNPCTMRPDPIEKKPLFHFLPGAGAYSLATSGCGFRCLNCQNWDISQSKPEETKDAAGEPLRLAPHQLPFASRSQMQRVSLFPADVVAAARYAECPTIAYTYSEPIAWYEYMLATAQLARAAGIKNVWVTCGYIQREPLAELCRYLDAASVNLKSFSDDIYRRLNSGRLQPILDTLTTLQRAGVWVEVINLIVPTYTDDPAMIGSLCRWLVDHLGPDCPLHFSRFHPEHKLTHLPPTPIDILLQARDLARQAGLRYVYLGNVLEPDDAQTTRCPHCDAVLIERIIFTSRPVGMRSGACAKCGTQIAGVWG